MFMKEDMNCKTLIIRQSTFKNLSTCLLRKIAQWRAKEGVRVVELSTTLDGRMDQRSNFHIEDRNLRDAKNTVNAELQEGKKMV